MATLYDKFYTSQAGSRLVPATPSVAEKLGYDEEIFDTRELQKGLMRIANAIKKRPDTIYYDTMEQLLEEIVELARRIAPYREGNDAYMLRKARKGIPGHLNEHIYYEISDDGKFGLVTVNKQLFPYAAIQHETPFPDYTHAPGKMWKFIEIPSHLIGMNMPKEISRNFMDKLRAYMTGSSQSYKQMLRGTPGHKRSVNVEERLSDFEKEFGLW